MCAAHSHLIMLIFQFYKKELKFTCLTDFQEKVGVKNAVMNLIKVQFFHQFYFEVAWKFTRMHLIK